MLGADERVHRVRLRRPRSAIDALSPREVRLVVGVDDALGSFRHHRPNSINPAIMPQAASTIEHMTHRTVGPEISVAHVRLSRFERVSTPVTERTTTGQRVGGATTPHDKSTGRGAIRVGARESLLARNVLQLRG